MQDKIKTCLEFFADDYNEFKKLCRRELSSVTKELNLYMRKRVREQKILDSRIPDFS